MALPSAAVESMLGSRTVEQSREERDPVIKENVPSPQCGHKSGQSGGEGGDFIQGLQGTVRLQDSGPDFPLPYGAQEAGQYEPGWPRLRSPPVSEARLLGSALTGLSPMWLSTSCPSPVWILQGYIGPSSKYNST